MFLLAYWPATPCLSFPHSRSPWGHIPGQPGGFFYLLDLGSPYALTPSISHAEAFLYLYLFPFFLICLSTFLLFCFIVSLLFSLPAFFLARSTEILELRHLQRRGYSPTVEENAVMSSEIFSSPSSGDSTVVNVRSQTLPTGRRSGYWSTLQDLVMDMPSSRQYNFMIAETAMEHRVPLNLDLLESNPEFTEPSDVKQQSLQSARSNIQVFRNIA